VTPVHTPRGRPDARMCERCPPRFLWHELRVLRPAAVVIFGRDAFNALDGHKRLKWRCGTSLCRGTLSYDDDCSASVFWLPHPTASDWGDGQEALIRSLRRKPLASG